MEEKQFSSSSVNRPLIEVSTVPEPGVILLMGIRSFALLFTRRQPVTEYNARS